MFYDPRSDNVPTAGVGFSYDTTRYASFGPQGGKRLDLNLQYTPSFQTGETTLSFDAFLDARIYLPLSRRVLFAIRGFGGLLAGRGAHGLLFRRPRHASRLRLPERHREQRVLREHGVPLPPRRRPRDPGPPVRRHPRAHFRRRGRRLAQRPVFPVLAGRPPEGRARLLSAPASASTSSASRGTWTSRSSGTSARPCRARRPRSTSGRPSDGRSRRSPPSGTEA